MIESNHVVLWNRCLEVIKDNVPETTYNTWFAPIVPLKYEDKTLILQIPSQFFYEILEERFVDLIRKTLYKVIGEGTKLMYNVMVDKTSIPNQTVNLEASNRSTAVTPKSIFGANKAPNFLQAPAVQDLDPHLNPNYNFELHRRIQQQTVKKRCRSRSTKTGRYRFQPVISLRSFRSRKNAPCKRNRHENQRNISRKKSFICFGAFISGSIYRLST